VKAKKEKIDLDGILEKTYKADIEAKLGENVEWWDENKDEAISLL